MTVFECNGCPTGPCTLINPDPEFEADDICPKKGVVCRAVFRELGVVE